MPKNFKVPQINVVRLPAGPGAWLRVAALVLAVMNAVALYLYFAPPGGSQRDLTQQLALLQSQVTATRLKSFKLKSVAAKVEQGSAESEDFESKYFLPRRVAYASVIAELQRIAADSGVQARDWVSSEEPIEGTMDLTLMNITANYEATYTNLLKFLFNVDKSPMLFILDTLTATPQQKTGGLNTSLKFQMIVHEDGTAMAGGQP